MTSNWMALDASTRYIRMSRLEISSHPIFKLGKYEIPPEVKGKENTECKKSSGFQTPSLK